MTTYLHACSGCIWPAWCSTHSSLSVVPRFCTSCRQDVQLAKGDEPAPSSDVKLRAGKRARSQESRKVAPWHTAYSKLRETLRRPADLASVRGVPLSWHPYLAPCPVLLLRWVLRCVSWCLALRSSHVQSWRCPVRRSSARRLLIIALRIRNIDYLSKRRQSLCGAVLQAHP